MKKKEKDKKKDKLDKTYKDELGKRKNEQIKKPKCGKALQ